MNREKEDILDDIQSFNEGRPKYKSNNWLTLYEDEHDDTKDASKLILCLDPKEKLFFKDNKIIQFIKDSTPTEFEIISSLFFKKILNTNTIETRKGSHDDGIDFYGQYDCDSNHVETIDFMKHNMWYIGQVKKYDMKYHIGTLQLRELIGTVALAREGIWSTKSGYEDIKILHYSGVIPIFITASYYSPEAWSIAKMFNIKLLDDIDLAFWLTIIFEGNYEEFKDEIDQHTNYKR